MPLTSIKPSNLGIVRALTVGWCSAWAVGWRWSMHGPAAAGVDCLVSMYTGARAELPRHTATGFRLYAGRRTDPLLGIRGEGKTRDQADSRHNRKFMHGDSLSTISVFPSAPGQ